ncbi:epi-neemfruitin B 7-O-acetyltransferse L7AT-like [Bidens hawaiensis]|uniref:epi-neemfruitin B 7-O-acetyltransferse L7AT-like n=1 Tax=Bidens hawaiensis TaxID=980011 RepID=UPI00404B3295
MKWLFPVHKATQRFLNSQQYHQTRSSYLYSGQFYSTSRIINASESHQTRSSYLYSGQFYSTSRIINASESAHRLANSNKKVDLDIISRETIKPSSPTPHDLRTFNLSIIDQFMSDVYTPFIVFIPNTNKDNIMDVVNTRVKHLKKALSETLTRFYPIAGKVKDNLQINCNDEGVYYMEALANQTLHDFLRDPSDERVRVLLPERPGTADSSKGNFVLGIQMNIFKCGGIGISTTISHKIFDAHTFFIFMKAWAATAKGSTNTVSPSFVGSKIFPNNPCLEYSLPKLLLTTKTLSTKRFVFDSTALTLLKAQPIASAISAHPPTRTEATTAVIWKAAAKAASKVRPFGPQTPHVLITMVNLRKRASPAFPEESIGNLINAVGAICNPAGSNLDLPTLMGQMRDSIAKINSAYVDSLQGVKGHETFNEQLRGLNRLADLLAEGDCLLATSLLKSGMYELDFGWGKPIWFYTMNNGNARRVALNETLKGGGVEAIVTLSPDEMDIFERDSELLSYVTVDPSPLRFVH